MSNSFNAKRKAERLIKKIKDTYTIESIKKLNPNNRDDKRILDAIQEYKITLKLS